MSCQKFGWSVNITHEDGKEENLTLPFTMGFKRLSNQVEVALSKIIHKQCKGCKCKVGEEKELVNPYTLHKLLPNRRNK